MRSVVVSAGPMSSSHDLINEYHLLSLSPVSDLRSNIINVLKYVQLY